MDNDIYNIMMRRVNNYTYGTPKKFKNQKKFWLIYLINEENESVSTLYAWTDNKELYERFKKERDMNLFLVKKRHYTQELSFSLALNSQGKYLEIVKGQTKDEKFNIIEIDMVMTMNEKMSIIQEYTRFIYQGIFQLVETPYEIFKDSLIESLDIIKYSSLNKIFNDKIGKFDRDDDKDDFYGSIKMDQLSVFIHLFGKTLKGIKIL